MKPSGQRCSKRNSAQHASLGKAFWNSMREGGFLAIGGASEPSIVRGSSRKIQHYLKQRHKPPQSDARERRDANPDISRHPSQPAHVPAAPPQWLPRGRTGGGLSLPPIVRTPFVNIE